MSWIRRTLITAALVGIAGIAAASDMTLTRAGDLYRVFETEEGLVVSATYADGTLEELLIPQTAGIVAQAMHVGSDEVTGSVFVLWQEGEGLDAMIVMAHRTGGTWYGPMALAGGDGTTAINPELLVFRHTAELAVAEDQDPIVVQETLLHLVWWSYTDTVDDGFALHTAIPVDGDGMPDLGEFMPVPVNNLLPFGIHCGGISNAPALVHPRLGIDPETGNPYVFATDFGQCLLQMVELVYQPGGEATAKRRRRVVIFGRSRVLPVRSDVPLAFAKIEVGHDLSGVIFWEQTEKIDYIRFDINGWATPRSLEIGDDLARDRAIELIQNLRH
jgi:hypothetical protein